MFCPPGFRRFDELFRHCLDHAVTEVEAGRLRPDASTKGTSLSYEFTAAMLFANRLLDWILPGNRLDPHLCDRSGVILRVDGQHFLTWHSWVFTACDADYWRRRNERYPLFDPRSGLISIRTEKIHGLLQDEDSEGIASQEVAETTTAFQGWAVCFPEATFSSEVPNGIEKISPRLRRTGSTKNAGMQRVDVPDTEGSEQADGTQSDSSPRVGRPRKQEILAEAYADLFPNGHEKEGKSLKEVLAVLEKRTGFRASEKTLTRALGSLI